MNIDEIGADLAKLVNTLRASFSERLGQNSTATAPQVSDASVKVSIVSLLATGPRNAQAIIGDLTTISAGAWTPTEAEIYPRLSELVQAGVLSFDVVEDQRTYQTTDAASAWLGANRVEASEAETETQGAGPQGAEHKPLFEVAAAKRDLMRASALLGQAVSSAVLSGDIAVMQDARAAVEAAAKTVFHNLGKSN